MVQEFCRRRKLLHKSRIGSGQFHRFTENVLVRFSHSLNRSPWFSFSREKKNTGKNQKNSLSSER